MTTMAIGVTVRGRFPRSSRTFNGSLPISSCSWSVHPWNISSSSCLATTKYNSSARVMPEGAVRDQFTTRMMLSTQQTHSLRSYKRQGPISMAQQKLC
ncbi:Uncharacterized protein HZ326_16333 [Fusarium oxysporum f. sp. albedinis]|nr:Uncharacterized protein HZ326_16333 [Fusarium oxysporum f. sp. albedinis]